MHAQNIMGSWFKIIFQNLVILLLTVMILTKKKKKRTKNSMVIVLIEICFSTLQDDIKAKWSKPLP